MTEQPRGALHFHVSKLLVATVILATAATGALIVTILIEMPPGTPPPPGPSGLPPPPPPMQSLAVFPVVTGFFVLSWLAVLVVFSRDQILRHLRQQAAPAVSPDELRTALADLRADLAGDRGRELAELGERLSEYGERRETDGYLNGMRAAAASDRPEPNVRPLRRNPPPR